MSGGASRKGNASDGDRSAGGGSYLVSSIPVLKPHEVVKTFEKLGWQVARQRGSHIIMTKQGHIATLSVPDHPEVARGTLRSLIAKAGISVEEFLEASKP
jgi:predicted RNA binding protein YcfA (HicA-like mRNA interferase family)